ncbi:unnamed protein product [Paramecium pentaurelia]|uniref:Oxidation resistance protein 1 n=1 Tax=Paramecium pentaurelia TaxID=43138 RepID=A0A8S1WNI2_9CILI|nr:unnamed protein product [Paramecium pentaurelia]
MGNEFCLSKRSPKRTILNDDERQQVKRLYKKLISRHDEQNDYLNEECFQYLLKNRPTIALKLFKYMVFHHSDERPSFEAFEDLVGKLTKPETLNRMTRTEQYSIISIQKINMAKIDYDQEKISYLDAFDLLSEIEYFIWEQGYFVTDYLIQDEYTTRSILSRLFTSSAGSIMFYELTIFLEQNFPCLSILLTKYFNQLFISQRNYNQLSKFQKPSYLVNNSTFGYMAISSSIIQEADSFELLWTSVRGWSFDQLYSALIGFKGATLILIKFDDSTENDSDEEENAKQKKIKIKSNKHCIVAALNSTQWIETNSYQGTSQSILFQLYPTYNPFNVANDVFKSKRPGSQNYCYINKTDNKKGLGFGGDMKQFRLWISAQNMQQSSYAAKQGEPYIKGDLIDPSIQTPTITYIEAWGVGNQNLECESSSEEEIKCYRESTNDLLLKYQS